MPRFFYEPAGPDSYVATESTAGPWSPGAQHGGPPSALAARALEAFAPEPGQPLASVALDILRPVPVGRLTTRTRLVRPGRRVALLETVLEADGQEVLHARGWRIERPREPVAPAPSAGRTPLPAPGAPAATPYWGALTGGYMKAIDWREASGGGLDTPGPAAVWARPTIPLLPGESLSPMSRALLIADSGNGFSALLDPVRFLFLNVDLRVTLHRDPAGDWLLLDATTDLGPDGTGLATSVLSDAAGPCGRGAQTLLVAPR